MKAHVGRIVLCLLSAFIVSVVANVERFIHAVAPCCAVVDIDHRTGIVTAKETATGRQFTFKVTDAKSIASLKVGQGIYANFTTKQVSLNGTEACCAIVNAPSGPAVHQARTFRGTAIPVGAVPVAGLKSLPTQPDPVPFIQSGVIECECGPNYTCPSSTDTPFGVKNVSPIPATAAITIRLIKLAGNTTERTWTAGPLSGNGQQVLGTIHRVADLCNNTVTTFPNYVLRVDYAGTEAQTSNDSITFVMDANTTVQ